MQVFVVTVIHSVGRPRVDDSVTLGTFFSLSCLDLGGEAGQAGCQDQGPRTGMGPWSVSGPKRTGPVGPSQARGSPEHGVSPGSPEGRRLNETLQGIRQVLLTLRWSHGNVHPLQLCSWGACSPKIPTP